MTASLTAGQSVDQTAIYWRWVKWSAIAAAISAALNFLVGQILFPGAPPKPLIADILITVTDILPFAVLQAHVLWSIFRVPRGAFIAWTVLPMLLIGGALLTRLADAPPSVPDPGPPDLDPYLTSAFGFAIVTPFVGTGVFMCAVVLAQLQWFAMNKAVRGLGGWLVWNGVGFVVPTLGLLALATWYGFEQSLANMDTIESSPFYFIGLMLFMVIANLFIGFGVARLQPRLPK